MKKNILISLLGLFLFSLNSSAQSTFMDSDSLKIDSFLAKDYVGKYKVKDAPIDEIIISFQDGKLIGLAGEQGSAELLPSKNIDIFSILGFDGIVEFIRNENHVVEKAKLTIQGMVMVAEKTW